MALLAGTYTSTEKCHAMLFEEVRILYRKQQVSPSGPVTSVTCPTSNNRLKRKHWSAGQLLHRTSIRARACKRNETLWHLRPHRLPALKMSDPVSPAAWLHLGMNYQQDWGWLMRLNWSAILI